MNRAAFIALTSLVAVLLAAPASADFRTKHIRLVPSQPFDATPGPIAVSAEVTAEHEDMDELSAKMNGYILEAFAELDYEVVDDAPVKFHYTIEAFNFGSAAKRLFTANLSGGGSYISGRIIVTKDGEQVGEYAYSSRPKGGFTGGSISSMAKEVGPPLILKWSKGDADEELHESPAAADKDEDEEDEEDDEDDEDEEDEGKDKDGDD